MSDKLNILVVEDEDLAARKLQKMLYEIDPDMCCIGLSDSINSTVSWIKSNNVPDLIFMDIELADGQSFEIFSRVEIKCPVIFTTAYDEYALKAFKVNSIDYLLKPIKPEELKNAIQKFKNLRKENGKQEQPANIDKLVESLLAQQNQEKHRDRFLVKSGQRLMPVSTDDIAYFYTEDKVVFLKTLDDHRFIIDYTLDELEHQLSPREFFRANRQFILNLSSIEEIHTWFNGKLKVSVKPKPEEEIVVSREKAMEFKDWLGN